MENKNIVMLKRHFVSYKDPKTTTYYLNQCRNLADYEVIDVTSKNRDPQFKSDISPMYIGPFVTPDGVIGIDANCYKTGFVNCIVLEEEEEYGE